MKQIFCLFLALIQLKIIENCVCYTCCYHPNSRFKKKKKKECVRIIIMINICDGYEK